MTDVPRGHVAIVGRDEELQSLVSALDDAARGDPQVVVVQGDAGVGKTRLLVELTDRAVTGGALVLVGHCSDLGGVGLPYLPFIEALRPLAGDPSHAGDRPPPPWLAAAGRDEVGQLQLFDAVATALAAAGRRQPVVLVLEDLHWSDESTRDLLMFLVRRLRDERLLVVASYRTDDLHRRHPLRPLLAELARLPHVSRLELDPFTADEMTRYLAALTGRRVPDETSRRILERSEGNAYLAAELLESGAGDRPGELPTALADVVLARLEGLPAQVVRVARVAAVGGRQVGHELLRAAAGIDDDALDDALREAVASHVLVPDSLDGYAFRHALLHEAVYGDLLPGERSRLHRAYARALAAAADAGQALAPAAELYRHCRESDDLPGALVAALLAADEAEGLHAPAAAWHQLEHALMLWPVVADAPERTGTTEVELTLRAAGAASRAGQLPRARTLAEDAVERLRRLDPPPAETVTASAYQRLAKHLRSADAPGEALAAAETALRLCRDDPRSDVAAWAAALAAQALSDLNRGDEARVHAEHAREVAADLGLAAVEADALVTVGRLDMAEGVEAGVDETLARAAEKAHEAGSPGIALRAQHSRALLRYDAGDLAGAVDFLEPVLAWCSTAGLTWSPYGLELRAMEVSAHYASGDWDRALRSAGPAGVRPPDAMGARLAVLALLVRVARGDPSAADRVAALAPAWDFDPLTALTVGVCAAEHHRWAGEPTDAVAAVGRALRIIDDGALSLSLFGIRLAAVGLGAVADAAEMPGGPRELAGMPRGDQADRLVDRAQTAAAGGRPVRGTLGPEGRAWLARAEAEYDRAAGRDPRRSVDLWRRATDAFAEHHPYERARCERHLATAMLASGMRDDAAAVLAAARRTATDLGATPLLAALDAVARRGRLGGRGADPGPLTAREREVLALVAEGLTNRVVGERLFLAEKTVSVHVSRILAKLDATSRTEAVTVAHRRGLLSDRVPQ